MPNPRETWLPGGQSRAHTPSEDALTTTPASFSELGTAVTCGTFPSLEMGEEGAALREEWGGSKIFQVRQSEMKRSKRRGT